MPSKLNPLHTFLVEKSTIWLLIITLIICWGVVLRSVNIGTPSYWLDEAFSIEIASQLVDIGIPSFKSLLSDDSWTRGFSHHYLLALVINYFGESEVNMRLLSLVSGVALIVTIVYFSLRSFGIKAAVISALLMSLGYWQIAWSRQAREYILLAFFFWLGMLIIEKTWRSSISRWNKNVILLTIMLLATATHWFGILLLVAIFVRRIAHKVSNSHPLHSLYPLTLLFVMASFSIYILRYYFNVEDWWIDVYSAFIVKNYWPLLLLGFIAFFTVKDKQKREVLVWITLTCLFGFLMIATAIPMVNMRYVFFLTPALAILSAASIETTFKSNIYLFTLLCTISLTAITISQVIVWQPKTEYGLEAQKGHGELDFFTPQPDFKSAYQYINTHLNTINLITPYPVISRRYRDTDDVLAFDIGLSFLSRLRKKEDHEPFSKVPFATLPRLMKALNDYDNLYFLVDDMYLQRISKKAQKTIYTPEKIVFSWKKTPNSSLYLFRMK